MPVTPARPTAEKVPRFAMTAQRLGSGDEMVVRSALGKLEAWAEPDPRIENSNSDSGATRGPLMIGMGRVRAIGMPRAERRHA